MSITDDLKQFMRMYINPGSAYEIFSSIRTSLFGVYKYATVINALICGIYAYATASVQIPTSPVSAIMVSSFNFLLIVVIMYFITPWLQKFIASLFGKLITIEDSRSILSVYLIPVTALEIFALIVSFTTENKLDSTNIYVVLGIIALVIRIYSFGLYVTVLANQIQIKTLGALLIAVNSAAILTLALIALIFIMLPAKLFYYIYP